MKKYDIYLIWGKDCDGNILRYYGSTANFIKRKSEHKINYERWVKNGRPNNKISCSSVYILDNGDWRMEKIEEVIGERWEAKKKEGEYIKNNECVNVCIASRTAKEYKDDHKEKITEYYKQYYEKHKDELNEKNKQKIICKCGDESTKNHISRHRKSKKHINFISNNEKMSNV
jgi:hypothetical protein